MLSFLSSRRPETISVTDKTVSGIGAASIASFISALISVPEALEITGSGLLERTASTVLGSGPCTVGDSNGCSTVFDAN
jgi:hypothetical protein